MKKKVLLVGEHPLGSTGNSGMMMGLIQEIDVEKYEIVCLSLKTNIDVSKLLKPLPFPILQSDDPYDPNGTQLLFDLLNSGGFEVVLFVGIDIWLYGQLFSKISELRNQKKIKWGAIFPYDLPYYREDWGNWIKMLDFPLVYSQFGEKLLKPHIPKIQYFRPPLRFHEFFYPLPVEERAKIRGTMFKFVPDDGFIFGFFGNNQIRKNPLHILKAYSLLVAKYPDAYLYLHTNLEGGVYNILQYVSDLKLPINHILSKPEGKYYKVQDVGKVMNGLDCIVNCTMQEGLSWIPLESMLCGVPVIISDITAHKDFDAGVRVKCDTLAYLPLRGELGATWVESQVCKPKDIAKAMEQMYRSKELRDLQKTEGLKFGNDWINGVSDINVQLEKMVTEKSVVIQQVKKQAVLFAQHSAAGDVLMTTRCFKGLKARHPDLSLVYMTSPQYVDVVKENPYLDEIIEWDDKELNNFQYVYNPHGERILPGHWGRNCNTILANFYWKILDVEPDNFYVGMKNPRKRLPKHFAVLHTTGGDPYFRMYKFMGKVAKWLRMKGIKTIQLGGKNDYPADADFDYRGKLSIQESNYVMSKASFAVTVDSYMSHVAGALGVSQVCLFGSGNYMVVRPYQNYGKLVCMTPDYVHHCKGLGPCSGSIKDCPTPCTGIHNPDNIITVIDGFLKEGWAVNNSKRQAEWERFTSR
jgi:glycosyltransferase involved in cell wall biosynthesis